MLKSLIVKFGVAGGVIYLGYNVIMGVVLYPAIVQAYGHLFKVMGLR